MWDNRVLANLTTVLNLRYKQKYVEKKFHTFISDKIKSNQNSFGCFFVRIKVFSIGVLVCAWNVDIIH